MQSQSAAINVMARSEPGAPVLAGLQLRLARIVWGVLVTPALVLFILAIPALYVYKRTPDPAVRLGLEQLGLPTNVYALYWVAILLLFAIGCLGVAAMIAWSSPGDPMALFASLFLVQLGAVNAPMTEALEASYPELKLLIRFFFVLTTTCLILFPFVFPDGRLVPGWSRPFIGVWIIGSLLTFVVGGFSVGFALFLIAGPLAGVAAQVYRYRRVSGPTARQQTKWVVYGVGMALAMQVLGIVFGGPVAPGLPSLIADLTSFTAVTAGFFLIPVTIGFAILRYRLWDIDLIINRTLVYGALTASVAGIYVLVVGGIGSIIHARGDIVVSLVGAGLVAVAFQPIRVRLQRAVNRLMYGDRDDPYGVISRLGQRLEGALVPDAVLPTIVETVSEGLKLPYVAITIRHDDSSSVIASAGTHVDHVLSLPLVYQHEQVGELLVAPRARGENFSPGDRRLLDDLARQSGVAVHAVRLTTDLQRSRERLVLAREEERRRLRRDLHDGLGPQLAGLTLKLETARNRLSHDPVADHLLSDISELTQSAINDIRRLVYALRPPALDELGLVAALQETATRYSFQTPNRLQLRVEAPDCLPPLPAAVEVAAYRIAQEAMTNVVRHAEARQCVVRLRLDASRDALLLEIEDDGRGLQEPCQAGVGMTSMRERVEELGGSLIVDPGPAGGTRVLARLPLPRLDDLHGAGEPKAVA